MDTEKEAFISYWKGLDNTRQEPKQKPNTRPFKVGDKAIHDFGFVHNNTIDKCEVVRIRPDHVRCVEVKRFDGKGGYTIETYCQDGRRWEDDKYPSLFHAD